MKYFFLILSLVISCISSAQQPELILPVGHTQDIFSTQFIEDGKYIITVAYDNTAKLWDVYSGKLLHTFPNLLSDPDYVYDNNPTYLSPDRKHLVASTTDGYLNEWELPSAKLIFSIKSSTDARATHFDYSPDGKYLLVKWPDATSDAKVIDASNGRLLYTINTKKSTDLRDRSLKFSPNGKYILAKCSNAGLDRELTEAEKKGWTDLRIDAEVIEALNGELLYTFNKKKLHDLTEKSFEFSPDGKYILIYTDSSLYLHDPATGKLIMKLEHLENFNACYFSPGGKYIEIFPKHGNQLRLWRLSDGDLHQVTVSGIIEFSPDGKYILSTNQGKLQLTDVQTGDVVYRFGEDISGGMQGHFSNDGKYIFLSSPNLPGPIMNMVYEDSVTTIWETASHRFLYTLEGHGWNINSVLFSPDNKYIATISGNTKLWETATGKLVRSLDGLMTQFNPNSKNIAVAVGRAVQILSLGSNSALTQLKGDWNNITRAIFSQDNKQVVTLSNEKKARLWDISKGKLMNIIEEGSTIKDADFSLDGKNLLITTEEGKAIVKNLNSGEAAFQLDQKAINKASYSPDGQQIISTADSSVCIWDVATGKLLHKFLEQNSTSHAAISPDGKYAYYILGKSAVGVLDIPNRHIFRDYLGDEEIISCQFSPDSRYFFILGGEGTSKLFENATGKMIDQFTKKSKFEGRGIARFGGYYLQNLWQNHFKHFSPDGKYVIARTHFDKYAVIRRMDDLSVVDTIFINSGLINSAAFVPQTEYLVTGSGDNTIRIWKKEKKNFRQLKMFYGDGFEISPDGKWLLIVNNVQLMFYDLHAQQFRFRSVAVNEKDYFTQLTDKPYYAASKNAAKELVFRFKDQYFSFDQFDMRLNRPDIVLGAIDSTATSLINEYRKIYYNRIKRLEIDTTSFRDDYSAPEADFVNRKKIAPKQEQNTISLHIKCKDKFDKLDRFNIWVNEVPLYGAKGYDIRDKKTKLFDTTVTIALSQGENRIETSVINGSRSRSYSSPLLVDYAPAQPLKDTLYFIGIGVNQYVNNTSRNLSFAAKDIRDLDTLLRKNVKTVISKIFIDSAATWDSIMAVKKILLNTGINDKVVIALSGHGVSYKKDFYFGTYDIDFDKPDIRGLKYEELESLLDDIPARRKLLLIDACHSGELDTSAINKDLSGYNSNPETTDSTASNKTAKKKGDPDRNVRFQKKTASNKAPKKKGDPDDPDNLSENSMGLDNSFELMKEVFADLSRTNGAVVISAARGLGYAEEDPSWNNGAFTLCIKAAFSGNKKFEELRETADKNGDGVVSINELKDYILTKVPQLTKERQKPTTRRENIEVDWNLW